MVDLNTRLASLRDERLYQLINWAKQVYYCMIDLSIKGGLHNVLHDY